MSEDSALEFYTIEQQPNNFFEKLNELYGGEWDGTHFTLNNNLGKVNVSLFTYPNKCIISIGNYNLNKPIKIINRPKEDERIVAVRIGFHGGFEGESTDMGNSEGIFIYDANKPFQLRFPKNKTIKWMSIRVPLQFINNWTPIERRGSKLMNILNNEKDWFFYYRLPPEIESLVRSAVMHMHNKDLVKPIMYARAYEIIARLFVLIEGDDSAIVAKKIHPNDFSQMHEVKEELLQDFSKLPNVEELSEKYGMSYSKLQRSFKAVFGMPIKKFYNQHRLEEVNRLIKYSSKSIFEISDELGFHSTSHLSRTFKQQFGYTPSEIRS
ncbi:helix-turn-helix transcriptional regulator [Saccharicrinis aurantiacus]|uniref:helix-turn-helix transcriptional regulator n=1 Tax=Saccharicrinis aurantiacus TaxID=1849719 RepID=UPI002493A240|nr:AraC family transcriptional regulator [Saccharicrinis aurantiacus]